MCWIIPELNSRNLSSRWTFLWRKYHWLFGLVYVWTSKNGWLNWFLKRARSFVFAGIYGLCRSWWQTSFPKPSSQWLLNCFQKKIFRELLGRRSVHSLASRVQTCYLKNRLSYRDDFHTFHIFWKPVYSTRMYRKTEM